MSTKAFNVSMSDDLVKKIDKQSKLQGSNRSDFIRQAVRKQLTMLEEWQAVTASMRDGYKGAPMTEEQVADTVRDYREKSQRSK